MWQVYDEKCLTNPKSCAILSENLQSTGSLRIRYRRRKRDVYSESIPIYVHHLVAADFSDYGHHVKVVKANKRMAVRRKVLFGYAGIRIQDRRTAWEYTRVYGTGGSPFLVNKQSQTAAETGCMLAYKTGCDG